MTGPDTTRPDTSSADTSGADRPWAGDACSLVDAFRRGERHPAEELAVVLAALEASELNPVCHLDPDAARAAARDADVSRPFGGVPIGVKELEAVAGWPHSKASVPLADRRADRTSTQVARLVADGGAVLAAQTTSSEFGGVNLTRTLLHGVTRNPWDPERTPGGSSGGSAAAVAGGLLPIATGSDGGGSIRIPAGFCGLVGLKSTYGRIPLGPGHELGNLTSVTGCMARSVRDTARWFDVVNGHHPAHPLSLPRVEGWEAGLGMLTDAVRGLRVAVVDDWGGAVVAASTLEIVHEVADWLADGLGWTPTDVDASLPRLGAAWSISGMVGIRAQLGDRYPDCADDLTPEIAYGLAHAAEHYGGEARARIEARRATLNDRMAEIFDTVDVVVTATNPDVAFAAEGPLPDTFGGVTAGTANNGLLTFPANLHGNPAISIPGGFVDGLPVGVQVIGRHFTEPLLLEIAHHVERERPWPLVTPA